MDMNKEQLFRAIYANHLRRDAYLDTVPTDLQNGVCDNQYVNYVWETNSLLMKAVFGEFLDSVEWFLYEWQPGFECGVNGVTTSINNIDEYIEWMKANEGFQ